MQYILVHGLGQTSSSWDATVSHLSEVENVKCPDLWALLDSNETTYANLYRAFSAYCDNIPGALNLCGLSLGGMLVLNYAIENPEKVKSIVLIGAQYKIPKLLMKFQNIIFRFMPNGAFSDMGLSKKDVIALTKSMLDLDFSKNLKHIPCPALILYGEKDRANAKAANSIAEHVPNASIKIIEQAGHEVNSEAPDKLAAALNVFWKSYE